MKKENKTGDCVHQEVLNPGSSVSWFVILNSVLAVEEKKDMSQHKDHIILETDPGDPAKDLLINLLFHHISYQLSLLFSSI